MPGRRYSDLSSAIRVSGELCVANRLLPVGHGLIQYTAAVIDVPELPVKNSQVANRAYRSQLESLVVQRPSVIQRTQKFPGLAGLTARL
jgi:hypothetical protein